MGKLWIPEEDDPGLRLGISERRQEKWRKKAGKKRGANEEGKEKNRKRGRDKEGMKTSNIRRRRRRIIIELWQNLKEITYQNVILSSAQ